MAGKGDIVEQALKLIAGGSDDAAKAAVRSAAESVPTHLRPGFTVQAAPGADEETRQLVDYLSQRDPNLAFDPQSLAERREDLGTTVPGFHGSPRDIQKFTNTYSSPEGYWGGHHYFTTSPVDASVNYATPEGADLFRRMEGSIERTLDNYHPVDLLNWYDEKYGSSRGVDPMNPKLVKEYADDIARQELGITNEGAVYPVNLRMKNPVKIDSPDQTFWGYDTQYDEAGDIVSEGGPAADLIQATRDAMADYGVSDRYADNLMGKLYERIIDYGGIDAKSYNDILRGSHIDGYDEEGNLVGMGQIMADAFRRMGHDSIDMPTDVFAGGLGRVGMAGTGGDTRHYIIFDPKNIRSRFGAYDPFKASSERISDAQGGAIEGDDDIDEAVRIAKGGGGGFTKLVRSLFGPSEKEGLEALTKAGSGYKGVPGKPDTVKIPLVGEVEAKPLPPLERAAEGYMERLGRPGEHLIDVFQPLDEDFARRVAGAYGEMKHAPTDPEVKRAYDALAQETLDQLEAAKRAGIDFSFIRGEDPYKASPGMGYADLAERGHLYVFPTDQGFGSDVAFDPANNPLLKRIGPLGDLENATVNDAFRIVHDLFGHYGPGNPFFRAPGEERAFKLHSRMYSPEARPAMASETRGQNSWLNFGPYGSYNRGANAAETIYADQKTGIMPPWTYEKAGGGAVEDALRIAKDVGGSTFVMMEDAKGNKYDAQGKIIPPQNPGPQPARSDLTPEQVGRQAAQDPATYDALMERYAVPDRDIAEYEALRTTVSQQPQAIQQMTHVGDRPRREMKINMPLFGGEYSMGTAPYDVAENMQGVAQTAYDFKTMPAYFFPATAPFALGADVLESRMANDPLGLALNLAFTPQGASAAKSALDLVRRNPKAVAAAVGAGSYLSPDEAQAGPERWFSKLFRAAETLPMEKMTGEQALAMLRKSAPQEEIKWTGLEGFASENPVTTKQALLDFIKRNQVQTQDVVLGGKNPSRLQDIMVQDIPKDISDKYMPQINELMQKKVRANLEAKGIKQSLAGDPTMPSHLQDPRYLGLLQDVLNYNGEIEKLSNAMRQEYADSIGGLSQPLRYGPGTRYEQYNTLGGEDYRETLVTLPAGDVYEYQVFGAFPRSFATKAEAEDYIRKLNAMKNDPDFSSLAAELEKYPPSIDKVLGSKQVRYKSGHWDQIPDIVGHIRTQMLTANPPGANRPLRLFNVDEAQSDWGKAGRDKGFVTAEDKASFPMLVKQYDELAKQRRDLERLIGNGDDTTPEIAAATKRAIEINRQMMALSDKMSSIRSGGVPAAPYVTSTQNWTDLSIKKALDQAIDSGADYFTFTPGEVQAKRYSLRNEVQGLAYDPEEKTLSFYPKDGRGWQDVEDAVPPEDLKKYIGEEAAKKLLAQEPNALSGNQILEGIDLEFGGEGMIDYYNNIYKKRVEKVVKDLTGKKVQWEVLPAETSEGIVPRLGFRIDDDLKEAKFPTFASGGIVNKALELTRDY